MKLTVAQKQSLLAGSALLGLLLAIPAGADEAGVDYANDTLSGDWSGVRPGLVARGMSIDATYKLDLLRNTHGGLATGNAAIGHLDIQMKADLEKVWGWSGVTGYVNLIDDRGDRINTDRVGSLAGVSNIEVGQATHRLYQAWLEKTWDDGAYAALLGLYPVDTEFAVMDAAGLFVQPPYGAWADYGLSQGPSIFNNSSFGLRLKGQADNGLYAQAAVLDGMPGRPDHPIGTHIHFGRDDGIQVVGEVGYRPPAADGAPEGYAKYMLGYWRYSSRSADLIDVDAAGEPRQRRSDGWYLAAERTLLRGDGDRNLTAFARYSFNDGDTIAVRGALNLGLRLRGLLVPGRDDDVFGIAWSRLATGGKFRAAQAAAGSAATDYEDSVELTYRIQARPWLAVQPVVQFIRHPGADAALHAARVFGLRLELAL